MKPATSACPSKIFEAPAPIFHKLPDNARPLRERQIPILQPCCHEAHNIPNAHNMPYENLINRIIFNFCRIFFMFHFIHSVYASRLCRHFPYFISAVPTPHLQARPKIRSFLKFAVAPACALRKRGYKILSKACTRSAWMSAASSMPAERRSRPSPMPRLWRSAGVSVRWEEMAG